MRVDVIPILELSEGMKHRWLKFQDSNSNLTGPCFHPDLFLAVGKFCKDVYVAQIYDKDELIGFLPYLRNQEKSSAQTIDFCDYQAIIGPMSQCWNAEIILKKIGLHSWDFNSLVDFKNIQSQSGQIEARGAMRVDLRSGYENYLLAKREVRIKFEGLARKKRLIESKFGPLRFVPMCQERKVMHRMLSWKSIRHNRDSAWTKLATDLLEHFCYSNQSSINGVLSALYAENELLAVFFGMRHQGILHSLVCSYNPDFEKYSPGLILWKNLIAQHKELQYNILDFGPSDHRYKRYFANSTLPIITGSFKEVTLKEEIKSVKWLYQGLRPIVQMARGILPSVPHIIPKSN